MATNKLMSEILFNRALIWIAIGLMESVARGSKDASPLFIIAALYNMYKSFKAWTEVE